jgi:hypothetical protein
MDGHYSCRMSFAKMDSIYRWAHEWLIPADPITQIRLAIA